MKQRMLSRFPNYILIAVMLVVICTPLRLFAQDQTSDAESMTLSFPQAILKDYSSHEPVAFSSSKKVYLLQVSGDQTACGLTEGYSLAEDKDPLTVHDDGYYYVDTSGMAVILRIKDPDGKSAGNYYFVLQDEKGEIPLDGQTEKTKKQADTMLTGWNNRSEKEVKTLNTNRYWDTFMSTATDVDLQGATVYDITKHKMTYPSDLAGCIIELVMTGKNPYNFQGVNYVDALKKRGVNDNYGPYANNTWALIAYRLCGEDISDVLVNHVIETAKSAKGGDIRPWALAALSDWDRIPQEDIVAMALEMKGTIQKSNGLWGNAYTNGCYLTGIGASGVNIDYFTTEKGTILDRFAEDYMTEDYKFSYEGQVPCFVKDAIIGLGDLIHERSIWASYALTPEKLSALLTEAKALNTESATEEEKEALARAIEAAEAVSGDAYGYGPAYYGLYEAMGRIDDAYNLHIRFCNKEQADRITEIHSVLDTFSSKEVAFADVPRIQKAWADYKAILKDNNKEMPSYVEQPDRFDSILEKMITAIDQRILEMDSETGHGTSFSNAGLTAFKQLKAVMDALDADQLSKLQNRSAYQVMEKAYEKIINAKPVPKPAEKVKVGTKVTVKGGVYKITANSSKKRTASLVGTRKKTIKKLVIPATISAGGKKYKVTAISAKAVKNRKKLTGVTVGKNVVKIGNKAFAGCSKLKKITIRSARLKKVGSGALKGIHKKAVIKVPKKKRKSYKKLFKNKGQKNTVKVS